MWRYRPCEARNATGSITAQYFSFGQSIGSSKYCYTPDFFSTPRVVKIRDLHSCKATLGVNWSTALGSIRELTDSTGNIQSQYSYEPYGRLSQPLGTTNSDFQYASYYTHLRSGLSLAAHRVYSPVFGRWISRDPMGESEQVNLYAYIGNSPLKTVDPSGNGDCPEGSGDCNHPADMQPWPPDKHCCDIGGGRSGIWDAYGRGYWVYDPNPYGEKCLWYPAFR